MDEAKLSLFSKYDKPTLPQNEGLGQFYHGITDEILQEKRDQYLNVGIQDLIDSVNEIILPKMENGESSQVIFGAENEEQIEELKDLGKT